MGRFRSFCRRSLRPVVMAVVAGSLALTLTVTTTQKAEASPLLIPPVVAGAVSGALPLAAWVGAVTPVGWVILGGVAIAGGLYYTKDYWLPYVTGEFGAGTMAQPSVQGGTSGNGFGTPLTGFTVNAANVSGSVVNIPSQYACPTSCTVNLHIAVHYKCKRADGSIRERYAILNHSNIDVTASNTALPNQSVTCVLVEGAYTFNDTPIGAEFGLAGDGALPLKQSTDKPFGPTNHRFWGNLAPGAFDPKGADVQYKNTVECVKPDGTLFNAEAISIGSDGALKYPSCDALWPGAHATGKGTVTGLAPGATVPQTLRTTPAITGTPYPKCEPGNPGDGCVLSVSIDGQPCKVGEWQCARWAELKTEAPARLQCNYGPYVGIAIDTCNPLERAYETGGSVLNETNTDGNPATRNDTDPNGQPIGKPDIAPSTGTGTVPGGAGAPVPGTVVPGTEVSSAECFPSGWSALNPFEWILKPIACAFIPKTNLEVRAQNTVNALGTVAPFSWFASMDMSGPGGGGCPDWNITIAGNTYSAVCDSSFTGAIVGSRNLIFTMLSAAMIWPLIRSLWYASIPFIRVQPGSSK